VADVAVCALANHGFKAECLTGFDRHQRLKRSRSLASAVTLPEAISPRSGWQTPLRPEAFLHGIKALCAGERMKSCQLTSIQIRAINRLACEAIRSLFKGNIMNKNQINGTVKDLAGKVQEEAGKLVGSKEQEAKGIHKQVVGKAEKRLGDVKEIVKDANDAVKDAVHHR
jgi:uncharacterized protein YjbJ (UPF0337 family)